MTLTRGYSVPRHKQKQITPSEIEALLRRYRRLTTAGGDMPRAFIEKYERLVSIAGDAAFAAEANHLAGELFAFLEVGARQVALRANRKDSQIKVQLEPHLVAALDSFVAGDSRVNNRPQAISMILNEALAGNGFLMEEKRKAS